MRLGDKERVLIATTCVVVAVMMLLHSSDKVILEKVLF